MLFSKEELECLRQVVLEKTGLDLGCYKESQLQRRLKFIIQRAGAKNIDEYIKLFLTSPEVVEEFKSRFTINVSEFFRNPEKFKELSERILPDIFSRKKSSTLRVWSAGCSVGSEPYSLAILFEEKKLPAYQILATDVDYVALEQARRGVYSKEYLKNVSPELLQKYFLPEGEDKFSVKPLLKKHITFEKHDLLKDEIGRRFDLVVCRNVVIYFEEKAKEIVFGKLAQSLDSGGYLWIGSTERINNPQKFGLRYVSPFFYQKE
ncbi:MAG: protein-glutamate O-methyltransferase CheR [Candidatus Atribacteria bacterium]|nr:protein-glutamate O-methyltransferase CheR [Candidatus Atribacteria bacterium]MCD6349307.1 protein-glutamate O-methyltransferase CheR [Candidatus Atribacteria bacterium]